MSLTDITTPEFLDDYADRLSQGGFAADAVNHRAIAEVWRAEQRALADAQADNTRLARALAELRRRISVASQNLADKAA